MTTQLSERVKEIIGVNCKAFWADLKIGMLNDLRLDGTFADSGHVFLYVDAWQGAMYFTDLGHYEDVQSVAELVRNYPPYKNRSTVSARNVVLAQVNKL